MILDPTSLSHNLHACNTFLGNFVTFLFVKLFEVGILVGRSCYDHCYLIVFVEILGVDVILSFKS